MYNLLKILLLCVISINTLISQSTYTQSYTNNGSWICPPGVTTISVECWGGGGAGGGTSASVGAGGGGAGGAYSIKSISVTPGTKYFFAVAQSKAGTTNAGSQGDPTWFNQNGANTQPSTISSGVLAEGGAGGSVSGSSSSTSGSKASSFGDQTYRGGNGGTASAGGNLSSSNSGAGGGGAGSTGNGGDATNMTAGTGTSIGGGNGASGTAYGSNVNGTTCTNTGGGGGGATRNSSTTKSGGAGGPGLLKITFSVCAPLFEQDFSSSSTISDYVYTTANETQFDEILSTGITPTSPSINSGMLRFNGTSGTSKSNFTRTTDFITTPNATVIKFDISFSSVTTGANQSAIFYIGTGMTTGTSGVPPTATAAHSRLQFATSATSSTGFQIRNAASTNVGPDGTNTTYFTGKKTITYVVNNSGASITYTAPDGTSETVGDDKEDVWVGTTKAINDDGAWGPTKALTDFAFYYLNGNMIIDIDNLTINGFPSAPTSSAATGIQCNQITANWTTTECSASLEVATDAAFTSMVSGYPTTYTVTPVTVTGLTAGTTYYYRLRTSVGSNTNSINSSYSATRSATTTTSSIGGTTTSNQTINSGQNPVDILVSGNTGSVTKWQSALDNSFTSASDIAVTNSTLLGTQMGTPSQTTYYRAVIQNGNCPVAYSSYLTITVAQPLPIELLYFKGISKNDGNLIQWATATEQNNDYFTLLWSDNGIKFTPIHKRQGTGNSSIKIEYEYLDEYPSIGVNYYVLRQTDYDGKYKDSYAISVLSERGELPVIINCTNILGQKVKIDEKGIVLLTIRRGNFEYVVKKVNE